MDIADIASYLDIVGENGAVKTALVQLLAKMYEPSSDSIFVDDTPLTRGLASFLLALAENWTGTDQTPELKVEP